MIKTLPSSQLLTLLGFEAPHSAELLKQLRQTRQVWSDLKQRCDNKNNKDYAKYGALGIKYSIAWNSLLFFLQDMGLKPEGKTLDRIDGKGNYCKENCRWATSQEQNLNRRKWAGVRFNKKEQKWEFHYFVYGEKHVRQFDSREEAERYQACTKK